MRRAAIALLLMAGFPCLAWAKDKPNIILFLVDDMGWTDCGAYGSQYYETPNVDQFAAQSMLFTDAYAHPLCSPSRASIMTGQEETRHGIMSAHGHQEPDPPGPQVFQENPPATQPFLLPKSRQYLDPETVTLAEGHPSPKHRVGNITDGPDKIPAGTTSDAIINNIDLYPTLLELAGVPLPENHVMDGLSFAPVLLEGKDFPRDTSFSWFPYHDAGISVRKGDWKLIRRFKENPKYYAGLVELYHLKDDLGETNNLAKQMPGKVAELGKLIDRHFIETGGLYPKPNPAFGEQAKALEIQSIRWDAEGQKGVAWDFSDVAP
ncbi:MAG TPA: sulfatase-like hydrolase/transferase [Sedimentisphaerales bacterium]|nr:sulfatase-like hydrolase/transferase [Sedimentisphaerales bacterium]